MAASKLQMNWAAVGFTPTGGTLISIIKVTEVNFDPGGSLKPYSGDVDRFPTTMVNDMNNPKATVMTGDVATVQALAPGTIGEFTATWKDAKLATGGDILYTLANAVVETNPAGGKHADYGSATLTLRAFSADGATNPLSFTRA